MKNRKVQLVIVTFLLVVMGIWLFPTIAEGQRKGTSSWKPPKKSNPQCPKPRPFCGKER